MLLGAPLSKSVSSFQTFERILYTRISLEVLSHMFEVIDKELRDVMFDGVLLFAERVQSRQEASKNCRDEIRDAKH